MLMGRVLLVLAAVAVVGCSSAPPIASPSPNGSPSIPVGASIVAGGCGFTPILTGGLPGWLRDVGARNQALYVLASPPRAAGLLFVQPLRAGHPLNPANKILWAVRLPRNGHALEIVGHPVGAAAPAIDQTEPADSTNVEAYPSILDVPQPGCWHFDLAWAGHKASVELLYQ